MLLIKIHQFHIQVVTTNCPANKYGYKNRSWTSRHHFENRQPVRPDLVEFLKSGVTTAVLPDLVNSKNLVYFEG